MSFYIEICHLDMYLNTTQDQPNFVVISELDKFSVKSQKVSISEFISQMEIQRI